MSDEANNGPSSHPFKWIPEFLEVIHRRSRSQARLLLAAMAVGVVAGLAAVVFSVACQLIVRVSLDGIAGYRPGGPAGEAKIAWLTESSQQFRPWLLLVLPGVGGLVSGYLVFRFAPEAEGHGTDSVIDAYHRKQGKIRGRVPIIKLLASAITIGTGGSGGREGPIALIGAGFGSALARLLRMKAADRRILVAAGMGAGVAAIFRAPLAGALFASEVLYWSPEFEPEVIVPAGIASVVSYSTFGLFFGWKPLFAMPDLTFDNAWQLLPYTLLALAMAILAMIYTRSFYWLTSQFHKLPVPRIYKPAIGATLSALVGLGVFVLVGFDQAALSVLSFGYGVLQKNMMDPASVSAFLLLAVALGKIVSTGLTIGSGGSGGVFGPSMVIGGCGGGALGILLHQYWPTLVPNAASFTLVGMAGFFAAAAKTPFSTLIIVCELTGDYRMIVPALWVCSLSFLLSDEQSLYQSQVETRSVSPAHQGFFVRQILAGQSVAQFLSINTAVLPIRPDDGLETIIERFESVRCLVLPVADAKKHLLGVIHLYELNWTANRRETLTWLVAVDLMRGDVDPLTPSDPLERAVELFTENDLPELPVVASRQDLTLVGMVRRTDIARRYLRLVHGSRDSSDSLPEVVVGANLPSSTDPTRLDGHD
jgi:chloride channel protein, CIC family